MIKNISAWKISSLNEYSVQIRLGSNLGGFFYFRKKEDAYAEKVDQMDPDEKIVEIAIERLRVFENHPFRVEMDSQMKNLQDSIKKYGIITPVIVRPRKEGYYEIISGHRRIFAAEKLGYRKVPTIIRYMTDDQAVIAMVDSNLQRERIQPSEKAFAYKMKYDVLKRKSGRRKAGQVDHNSGKKGLEIISEETGDSPKQVQRYIKMADLIPELLEKVDDGSMGFTPAVQIAYLKKKEQKDVLDDMELTLCTPSLSQAMRMKKLSADGKLTTQRVEDILSEIKQKETDRVVFKNDQLHKYFPKNYQKVGKMPTITDLQADFIPLHEAAALLGITKEKMSVITRASRFKDCFEIQVFEDKKWISKKSFQHFLNAQSVYQVVKKPEQVKQDNPESMETKEYISRPEAAALAGVTSGTITKWMQMERFSCVGAGKVLRINRKEFLQWLKEYQEGAG